MESTPVVVIGAGQAGLATSRELTRAGVEHLVLERGRIGETWRNRWDSFCLVTPNWTVQLPDGSYDGADPNGFMPRDEIFAFLTRYAANSDAPVREHVEVISVVSLDDGFALHTSAGDIRARAVVLATGAYQRPHRPSGAESFPDDLYQVDVDGYRNESQLPQGRVLVVGSGQSGCQVTEELREAGRDVVLSCGKAPWAPRRIGGHDLAWWANESGFWDQSVEDLPSAEARLIANVLATGRGGGHDLHLRTLQTLGVVLAGHFIGASDREVRFAPDLAQTVAWGDERYLEFVKLVGQFVSERGLEPIEFPMPEPFVADAPESLDLKEIGGVIFAGGFRPDYRSWLPWPEAFDSHGFPIHREGASTVVPGLYFVGVHFLRKRKSSLLIGVGEDAAIVAKEIAGQRPLIPLSNEQ
jgi:putative flavoprotein involved in K+ transport